MFRPRFSFSFVAVLLFTGCGTEQAVEDNANVSSIQAALTCSGASCNGVDPELSGCGADATTIASQSHLDGGQVELRWSKACGTKWARVTRAGRYETSAWLETTPYSYTGTLVSGSFDEQVSRLMWGNMNYSPRVALSACTYITRCLGGCGSIIDYKCTPLAMEP